MSRNRPMPRKRTILLSMLSVSAVALVDVAAAQSLFTRDRNVSVLQRERPEYAAQGIKSGGFIVRPKVSLTGAYTDNTFAIDEGLNAQFGNQEDYYVILRPSVDVESTWSRHSLNAGAYVEAYEHVDFDEANALNAGVYADGEIDVNSKTTIELGGAWDQLNESRKVPTGGDVFEDPIEYTRSEVYGGVRQEFGRIRYRGRLSYADYDYEDAVSLITSNPVDQDYRDREETSLLVQAGYAMTKDSSVFARARYRVRNYTNQLAGAGFDRDSTGYNIAAGVDFDVSKLVRGTVALGYLEEEFEDPTLASIDGVSVEAALEWFPSELTTVGARVEREVRSAALQADASFLATEFVLDVDHELKRNIILSGSLGYATDDYENIAREDERIAAQFGAIYLINQLLTAGIEYTYEDLSTDSLTTPLKDYTTNELMLTLTAER